MLKTGLFPSELVYDTTVYKSGNTNLPKLKLNNFDGNPLEWPEWSSMFIAIVYQRPIPNSMKVSHLKTLLTSKAMSAISGMGYFEQFYGAAWRILERMFGRPHVIKDGQLESLRNASQVKPHNSTVMISVSVIVSKNLLKEYKQLGNLHSSSIIYFAVDKLPQDLEKNWGSMLTIKTMTDLIRLCFKNGYLG